MTDNIRARANPEWAVIVLGCPVERCNTTRRHAPNAKIATEVLLLAVEEPASSHAARARNKISPHLIVLLFFQLIKKLCKKNRAQTIATYPRSFFCVVTP